ncbi:MAG: D-aminoacyl-tRNA deacylase, partial [Thermovirgaceae bacterium]|nr:D-aminoacyl-tRNA deacylase [Thermovirgaceae bacterium]
DRPRKAVYFFCVRDGYDHVSRLAFERVREIFHPRELDIEVDGYPVMEHVDEHGNRFCFMRQEMLVSYDFRRYLPVLREHFLDFDLAAEVNWHEGANAPDKVLTVHTIGDVEAGIFPPADSRFMRNLLHALEKNRSDAGLDDFTVVTEATHWTGTFKDQNPEDLHSFPIPMLDIEIGSTPASWEHAGAIKVLTRSLTSPFSSEEPLSNVICVGGVHFEHSFSEAAMNADHPFGISHILPNQWIVSGGYGSEENYSKLLAAARSIRGGVRAVVYHEGIKSVCRDQCRRLGEELGVPVLKHKALRKPADLSIW